MTLSQKDLESYDRDGFVILHGLVPRETVKLMFDATAALYRKFAAPPAEPKWRGEPWSDLGFHNAMMEFRKQSPEMFGALYDSMQSSVVLQDLICDKAMSGAAASLLQDDVIGLCATGSMLRMDTPGDVRNRLEWHQESSYYTQNVLGCNGIVAWIPMQNLTKDHGPILVCPGSHRGGKITVLSTGKADSVTSEQYVIPQEHVDRYETIPVLAAAGDVVLFHMDLFHRSGHNVSKEIRFTAGARYHRMLTDDFVPGRLQYVENAKMRQRVMAMATA